MLNAKFSKESTIISVLVLVFVFLLGGIYQARLLAQAGATSPDFPTCQSLFGTDGDIASYDSGTHQIVGNGLIDGSDNVYSQGSGNYLQCYCPAEETAGIQTVWWLADSLSQEDVDHYVSLGWIYENGLQWNLGNHMYLAKNSDSVCAVPTPTVTPTLTPSPSPTPTVTPTPGPAPENPRCVGLSASPSEGSAPLTVVFTGSGFDKNGPILEYEFDFGDASGFQPQIWKQKESEASHRYEKAGTYIASLKVKDQGGVWRDGNDDCRKTITVKSTPTVLSAGTPDELPSAGISVLALAGLAPLGYYLYRRFKLL
jgi:hypothetical protein